MTKKNIYLNGQEIEKGVPGFALGGTTYMPIWYVMHALDMAGYTSKWSGSAWDFMPPSSVKVNKTNIQPGTGSMSISLGGTLVQKVNGVQAVDPNSKKDTTFMPVWYVMQTLKRAGVTSAWDGTNWKLSVSGAPIATSHPTLQIGAQGPAVKELQQLLKITADGVFGPQTAQAVKSFQAKNHLTADGVVGPQTWSALLK
ncbi:peptidoglycan-binding protein [Alicyclobacillus curvatus]|nr:peptidoglycan-binding protein [Alicyclobacillus curvatus]